MADEGMETSDAVLKPMTAGECADSHRRRGTRLLRRRGCLWKQIARGYWEPIHVMARLRAEEAVRPTWSSWGFRAALRQEDASAANGSIPVFYLPDLDGYDESRLSSNRRNQLRRCHKRAKIVPIAEPNPLLDEAYEIFVSAVRRTAHTSIPSREQFVKELTEDITHRRHLVLAGLVDGKLGGYVTGYAIEGTAYVDQVIIATEAMSSYIGIGLQFEFAQICRRSAGIVELVHGLHSPEDEPLCTFKEGMGYRVLAVPARVWIAPILRQLLRRRYPYKYYRLTGER